MSNWIDRDRLFSCLKKCDIPVTKSERAIIMAMPCRDDEEYLRLEKERKLREVIRLIHDHNRPRPIGQELALDGLDDEFVPLD